jgi:hypothetical protein
MAKLRIALEASPIHRGVLNEAYEDFRQFGELPDEDLVAYQVVQRALRGGEEAQPEADGQLARRRSDAEVAYRRRSRSLFPMTIRELLFHEALFEPEVLRNLTRHVIAREVWLGADVESTGFAARHGTPTFGSATYHVAGFPWARIKAPYEYQATELRVRFDHLRARIPAGNPRWFEVQAKAIIAFREDGTLPRDDLHLEMVLANVELEHMLDHPTDDEAPLVIRLFRDVAWLDGDEQAAALQKLQHFAKAGRFRDRPRSRAPTDAGGTSDPQATDVAPPADPS